MAFMEFREPNQVKWQGVRPAHNGKQVLEYLASNVVGNVTIYTVPADKTLFLTYASLWPKVNASNLIELKIYTPVPVLWKEIGGIYSVVGQSFTIFFANFNPPIEVPANYLIIRRSSGANLSGASIHGWVE